MIPSSGLVSRARCSASPLSSSSTTISSSQIRARRFLRMGEGGSEEEWEDDRLGSVGVGSVGEWKCERE